MGKKKSARKTTAKFDLTGNTAENAEAVAARRGVRFVFRALDAKEVYLTGEFNNWDTRSLPMKKRKGGEWQAEIDLDPGRYEYNFFVDGVWVQDPVCHERVLNTFGTQNCIIQVG